MWSQSLLPVILQSMKFMPVDIIVMQFGECLSVFPSLFLLRMIKKKEQILNRHSVYSGTISM